MPEYQTSGTPQIIDENGIVINLPYPDMNRRLDSRYTQESRFTDMGNRARVLNGKIRQRPVFVFGYSNLPIATAQLLIDGLRNSKFITFIPRTRSAADSADAEVRQFQCRVVSNIPFTKKVNQTGYSIELELVSVDSFGFLDSGAGIFFIDDVGIFHTMNHNLTNEVNTGLDVSGSLIIDIAYNTVDRRIYGLATGGGVWSWNESGGDFRLIFNSGLSQVDQITINQKDQVISLSKQQLVLFNDRTHYYSLTGTPLYNWENRYQTAILQPVRATSGGRGYSYITSSSGNFKNFYRMRLSDGFTEHLQAVIFFGGNQDSCINDAAGLGFHIIESIIYQYDLLTVSNPAQGVSIGSIPFSSGASIQYFESEGNSFLCGGSGNKMWVYDFNTGQTTVDVTNANCSLVATSRPFVE